MKRVPLLTTVMGKPWLWSFLAALLIWIATIAFTGGQGAGSLLSGSLSFSASDPRVDLQSLHRTPFFEDKA